MNTSDSPPVGALTTGEIAALRAWADDLARAAVAQERERAAVLVETLTYQARWISSCSNSEPVKPCALAAAIRAG